MTQESAGLLAAFERYVPFDGLVPSPKGPTLGDALRTLPVPAVSVAAVVDGEVRWSGAWGVTDTLTHRPVSPTTAFQAGSISKTVAAFVALELVDKGLFSLDDDVNEIAGTLIAATASGGWRPRVTVRQLLSHTAGINNGGFNGYEGHTYPNGREIIAGSERSCSPPVRVIGVPGTRYSYSGGGFVVLQEVIAKACDLPFAEVAKRELFSRAGMTRSTYDQDQVDEDRAYGHRHNGEVLTGRFRRYPEMAAAGLWTTATDLARFLAAAIAARTGKPGALISLDIAKQMLTSHSEANYGLGFRLLRVDDCDWFGHGGDTQGFQADVLATSSGLGYAVMTNSDLSSSVINAVRAAVARLHDWPAVPGVVSSNAEVATDLVPHGRFVDANGHAITLTPTSDGVNFEIDAHPPLALEWDGSGGWTSTEVNVTVRPDGPSRVRVLQTLHHGPVEELVADAIPES